jgi:crotonobetainyl-CoA:carnitine CoA-transferase CaiB-like acyl-CoA transferase
VRGTRGERRGRVRVADVFVLNFRGKAAERLGLDYASVKTINPDIIYVHCIGFAQDGPYADLQAYDDVIPAASSTTSLLSRVDAIRALVTFLRSSPTSFPACMEGKIEP